MFKESSPIHRARVTNGNNVLLRIYYVMIVFIIRIFVSETTINLEGSLGQSDVTYVNLIRTKYNCKQFLFCVPILIGNQCDASSKFLFSNSYHFTITILSYLAYAFAFRLFFWLCHKKPC